LCSYAHRECMHVVSEGAIRPVPVVKVKGYLCLLHSFDGTMLA